MENAPLTILLADDDEGDRFLFKEALVELKIDCVVTTVNNGMQLMDRLAKNDAPLPHLIFLDLNMPRKNGLDCLKEIRINNEFQDILIAIYSTSGMRNDIDETMRSGANLYIKKPDDFRVLRKLLAKLFADLHLYRDVEFCKENFVLRIDSSRS